MYHFLEKEVCLDIKLLTIYLFMYKYCNNLKYWDRQAWANCVDPDQMPQNAVSDQGLHCLPLIQQLLVVCIEFLQPSQPTGVISSVVSLPNHTFTGQAESSKWWTSIVHILLPEIDNNPSWISRRERLTIENISWSISMKECCQPDIGQTHNFRITSRTGIQLSCRGAPAVFTHINRLQNGLIQIYGQIW